MWSEQSHIEVISLYDQGEFASAAQQAWLYLQDSPDDGQLWQLYGAARCQLKEYHSAREALETASMLVPLHPLGQFALATAYHNLQQTDLAYTVYEHLGRMIGCTGMLGVVVNRLGGIGYYAEAVSVCERITRLEPHNHQAYFATAFFQERLGADPSVLIPSLALAVDLAPDMVLYRLNLAYQWARVGDYQQARELLFTVPLEQVHCSCWLKRLQGIYRCAGDLASEELCRQILTRRQDNKNAR